MCIKMDYLFILVTSIAVLSVHGDAGGEGPLLRNTAPVFPDPPHECERKCVEGSPPKKCQYHFIVEWYLTMSKACYDCPTVSEDCNRPHCVAGDGQRRQFISVNRQLPGPKIEVCHGDTISAKVSNRLGDGRVLTMHWHGQHQVKTPWMDGVPYVTQCPVLPKQDFTYEFEADPAGTYMYHSHVGLELSDGMFGPLIVKQPPSRDPSYDLYSHDCDHTVSGDCEHVMVVNDWTVGEAWGDYVRARWYSGQVEWAKSGLMNGMNSGQASGQSAKTPYPVFPVENDKNYRFRVINLASTECRYRITVDSHPLTVIATDGYPVEPTVVDAITYFPGERYDFIVNATKNPDNYWIKGRPIGECGDSAAVYGILRYPEADNAEPQQPKDFAEADTHLNPIIEEDDGDWGSIAGQMRVSDLHGYEQLPAEEPTVIFAIGMDEFTNNPQFNHPKYYSYNTMEEEFIPDTAVFNNISFAFPLSPPLFQYDDVPQNIYCNRENTDQDNCFQSRCHCTHRIKVPLNAMVEMILVNEMKGEGAEGHPIHLHGHHFYLLSMGKLNRTLDKIDALKMNSDGKLPKNLVNPPIKDTVQVTGGGYALIRFKANNPGMWLLHCHIQWHMTDGQALIMQVGEPNDFRPVPDYFPRCGPYPASGKMVEKKTCKNNDTFHAAPYKLLVLILYFITLCAW